MLQFIIFKTDELNESSTSKRLRLMPEEEDPSCSSYQQVIDDLELSDLEYEEDQDDYEDRPLIIAEESPSTIVEAHNNEESDFNIRTRVSQSILPHRLPKALNFDPSESEPNTVFEPSVVQVQPPTTDPTENLYQPKYRQVLTHIPTIPHVPIVCSDGSRVYLRVHTKNVLNEDDEENDATATASSFLKSSHEYEGRFHPLGEKYAEIKEEAKKLVRTSNINSL